MTAELKTIRAAYEKLIAGKNLEGEAKQTAFNLGRRLEGAERLTRRGKQLSPVERKLIVRDVEKLQGLLASLPKNGES